MSQIRPCGSLLNTAVVHGGAAAIDLGRDGFTLHAAAALMRHPHFEAATILAAEAIVHSYRGSWMLNRIVNDRGRMISAMMVLELHFVGGGGFTVVRLREEAARYGFASPRRVAAWVASLKLLGFLMPVSDSRPQRLEPTEPFLELHRERLRRQWAALALISPQVGLAVDALEEPAVLGRCVQILAQQYRRGIRVLDLSPEITNLTDRDAGLTVLLSLFLADRAGEAISIAALARRFSVSRAHVLALLREAEGLGLATRNGPRSDYHVEPLFYAVMRRFFASIFLLHSHLVENAVVRAMPVAAFTSQSMLGPAE